VFDSTLVPIDIDFDAGLSRISQPPLGDQGADPAPRVAAAGSRYAVVWESRGGIRMQLFGIGPYSCPADQTCRAAVPLTINGDASKTFNLELRRGENQNDPILQQLPPHSWVRLMVSRIVGGLFLEPLADQSRRKLNIYYLDATENSTIAGLLDKDATGIARGFGAGFATGSSFRFDFQSIASFRHEGGHGMFGVKDEYGCTGDSGTSRAQSDPFPNIFSDLPICTALSSNPGTCRLLAGAPAACSPPGNWSKSDPDDDLMGGGNSTDTATFGGDCRARISWMFGQFP